MSFTLKLMDDFHHVGWIPNTAGHVYFRNAKARQGIADAYNVRPPTFISSNEEGNSFRTRLIISSSLCDLNDLPPNLEESLRFTRFVVKATSLNKGSLEGKIWLIWEKNAKPNQSRLEQNIVSQLFNLEEVSNQIRSIWSVETEPLSVTTAKEHDEFCGSSDNVSELFSDFKDKLKSFDSVLNSLSDSGSHFVSSISFNVTNCGFCYLRHDSAEYIKEENNFKLEVDAEKETQMGYYYLKYLLHNHAHHGNKLDSFCRLHRIKPRYNNDKDINLNLATKLVRDIKANLVEVKQRRAGLKAFTRNSFGCVAYGKALIQQLVGGGILDNEKPEHKSFVDRQMVYLDCLAKSIEVKQEEFTSTSLISTASLMKSLLAFVLMVLAPLLIYSIRTLPDSSDNAVITSLTANGIITVFSVYLSITLVCWLFSSFYLWASEYGKFKGYLLSTPVKFTFRKLILPKNVTPRNKNKPHLFKCAIGFFLANSVIPRFVRGYYWKPNKSSLILNVKISIIFTLFVLVNVLIGIAFHYFMLSMFYSSEYEFLTLAKNLYTQASALFF